MNSIPRFIGYSAVLLLLFLVLAVAGQSWLQRATARVQADAIADRRTQFESALRLSPPPPDWNESYRQGLEGLLGASIGFFPAGAPASTETGGLNPVYFDHPAGSGPAVVRVSFPLTRAERLAVLQQRMLLALVLIVPVVFVLLAAAFVLGLAKAGAGSRPELSEARAEIGSLEHLARASVERGEALDQERVVRRRAEEDVELQQRLLAQALDEKIRIGRDLHDGIIQSLYAVGLTLESVRKLNRDQPDEADRRLESCRDSLNRAIRDVRTYIAGLAPENLRRSGFTQALNGVISELRADRSVDFELRIDDAAATRLAAGQDSDVLQIAREAISNSLRHGGANRITVRLHHTDREVGLLIQDNGVGFESGGTAAGHGLGNMRARAERLGAQLRVDSQPGAGTRVAMTLPVAAQPS